MTEFLKSIQTQLDNCDAVLQAYQVQGVKVIDGLMQTFDEHGVDVGRDEVKRVLDGIMTVLAGSGQALKHREQAVVDERSDDPALRATHTEAIDQARVSYQDTRVFIERNAGPETLETLGLTEATPQDTSTLRKRCEQSARLLDEADFEVAIYGMSVPSSTIAAPLAAAAAQLASSEAALALEQRELLVALDARDRTRASFERVYRGVVTTLVALLELVGETRLAGRLRPTQHHTSGKASVDTPSTQDTSEDAARADTDAPDAAATVRGEPLDAEG